MEYPDQLKLDIIFSDERFCHQREFYNGINNAIVHARKGPVRADNKRIGIMICIPTGGGKTRLMFAYQYNCLLNGNPSRKVLWISEHEALLEQTKNVDFLNTLKSCVPEDAAKTWINSYTASYYGTHADPITDDIKIVFANFATLRNNNIREEINNWLGDNCAVIIDEAHHSIAFTYQEIIEHLSSVKSGHSDTLLFGLSATPLRAEKNDTQLLRNLFPYDPIKEDGTPVHVTIWELIKQKALVEPKLHISEYELQNMDKSNGWLNTSNFNTFSSNLAKHIDNSCIVKEYSDHIDEYKKTIVFAINQKHAEALKTSFEEKLPAEHIFINLSSHPQEDNKAALEAFRNDNDPCVMINVNMLGEGIDVPDVNAVFLARPVNSRILVTQMV